MLPLRVRREVSALCAYARAAAQGFHLIRHLEGDVLRMRDGVF